jgi:hypothetical protein
LHDLLKCCAADSDEFNEKLNIPIGGIYMLARAVRDSSRDHPTSMEILVALSEARSALLALASKPLSP